MVQDLEQIPHPVLNSLNLTFFKDLIYLPIHRFNTPFFYNSIYYPVWAADVTEVLSYVICFELRDKLSRR